MKTATYILTIDERKDRRAAAESQMAALGIDATVWIAHKEALPAWSNFQSHRNMVKDAVALDCDRVAIFEDDFVLREGFKPLMDACFASLPPYWHMLLLGACLHEPPEWFSQHLYRVNNHTMMHAYELSRAGMQVFLEHAARLDAIGHCHSWDAWMGAQEMNRFLTRPILAIQSDGQSDITDRWTRYEGEKF